MEPIAAASGATELAPPHPLRGTSAGLSYETLAERHAETEAKYRSLVEQLPCVVYLAEYGPDGDWLYISPQIEQILGYSQREWLEHPHPIGLVHPSRRPPAGRGGGETRARDR